MSEFNPGRDSMRKMMIAVAAAHAPTATMATDAMAFGRGGGGGHFGGGCGGHFGGGRFAGDFGAVFGRGFRGGFGGLYGFGGALPYYGYATVTPSRPTSTLGSATEIGGVLWWRLPHRTYLQLSDRRMV
jgi:hypothetical protein